MHLLNPPAFAKRHEHLNRNPKSRQCLTALGNDCLPVVWQGLSRLLPSELLGCPGPTGMPRVPRGPFVSASATTGIRIAKSIERRVPDGLDLENAQRISQGNPDVIDNQKPTVEVLEIQFPAMPN